MMLYVQLVGCSGQFWALVLLAQIAALLVDLCICAVLHPLLQTPLLLIVELTLHAGFSARCPFLLITAHTAFLKELVLVALPEELVDHSVALGLVGTAAGVVVRGTLLGCADIANS